MVQILGSLRPLVLVLSLSSLPSTNAWTAGLSPILSPHQHSVALYSETSSQFSSEQQQQQQQQQQSTQSHTNKTYSMKVSYDGRTVETNIRKGEPILTALERTGAADALAMPSLPSDCRRGNCLTCVGRHAPDSLTSNLDRGEDGLSPHMSKQVQQRGYILTCSSYVTGDGVKLQLGKNNKAWDELYKVRLEEESTQLAGREAMAKTIRFSAERNPQEWARETEKVLKRSEQ